MTFRNERPKYGRGSFILYNPLGDFGNEEDEYFHIHTVRRKVPKTDSKREFLYDGRLFKIKKYDSKGIPNIPSYSREIEGVTENQLKGLEHLVLKRQLHFS